MVAKKPRELEAHGHVRRDEYYWLRERENPEVIAYLEEENAHTKKVMDSCAPLQETLYQEIKGRIPQADSSVPSRIRDYYYYTRFEDNRDYPIYCRKTQLDGEEQIMLDVNDLAEGHDYYSVGVVATSPSQDMIAFSVDTVGRRIYTLYFKNLTTGEILEEQIPNTTSSVTWAEDGKHFFYVRQDLETLRWDRVYRHVLGSDPAEDVLVFEEMDDTYDCQISKSKSRKFLMISSWQTISSEYRILESDNPTGAFRLFQSRIRGHEYSVDHLGDTFYVGTNHEAINFKLMTAPEAQTEMAHWTELVAHREDTYLENFDLFDDFLALKERRDGLIHMRIMPWSDEPEHYLDFGEEAYQVYGAGNNETDTSLFRYGYSSLTTPHSTFDYNTKTREKTLLKQKQVLGGFDKDNYETQRVAALAEDGTQVPITLVYRKDMKKEGGNPLLLYGYGSYGHTIDVDFRSTHLSLLDRGFVFAIAHIRGGQLLGRKWYEDGKLLKKRNTFTDFIACARNLVESGYAHPNQVFAQGGSAGGLLMGAVVNMAPGLFKGIVAGVPFVDVMTTMLDSSIPLTTSEYDEWGNPGEKEFYDYMLSYSPYDNVKAQEYPHMLVVAGLHDSQVQYWEPAKWVARLRDMKTDDHLLLLKTEMDAGHSGASARDKQYKEIAFEFAFLLHVLELDP